MSTWAVIFDRDETLTYPAPAAVAGLQARLVAAAPGLSVQALQATWEAWPGPWPRDVADEPAFWGRFCAAFGAACGLDSAASAALAAEVSAGYPTIFHAYPDALPAITALHHAGLRLAVLTNFELPGIAPTLTHAGLAPGLFNALISATALGWAKPDPRAFLAAAAALGVPPQACCFVDDLAENVRAARSIGMRAYQIDRSLQGPTPDGRIGSLLDLIGLLSSSDQGPDLPPYFSAPYDMTA